MLQERDAQVELEKKKKQMTKEIDQEFVEMEKKQMKDFDEKEKKKAEELEKLKQKNADIIKSQWEEAEIKKQKLAQEARVEGELIKKQVTEELAKDYEKELAKKAKM